MTHHTRRRPRTLWATAFAGLLLVTACGGDDDGGSSDDSTASDESAPSDDSTPSDGSAPSDGSTPDTPPADSSTPSEGSGPDGSAPDGSTPTGAVPGGGDSGELSDPADEVDPAGTLRFAYTIGPSQGLDPHRTSLSQDTVWLAPLYDPLVIELPDASLVPGLATEWEFVDDNTALVLSLREGVTFHDGEPFDADAVKANIERAKTLDGSAVAPLLAVVDSVEVVDEMTVRFELNGPAATLPRILADRPGMMISPAAMDSPELPRNPVGTGMYRIEEYREGDRAIMVPFEDYWNPDWVKLGRLEIVLVGDSTTRLNGLRSGQFDLVLLDAPQYEEAQNANLSTEAFDTTTNTHLQFNRTRAEFDNLLVRQAMNHAIDRDAIAASIYLGYATGSPQFYTEAFPDGHIPELEDRYPYDPDKARELLDEAGVDGFEFDMLVSTLPTSEALAQVVQAQLAEVGITANIIPVDPTNTASAFFTDQTGDVVVGTTPGRTDPAMLTQLYYTAEAHSNPGAHTIPEITAAYEEALVPRPEDERRPILLEMMTQIVEQAGHVPLIQPKTLLAGVEEVAGFHWSLRGQPDFRGTGMTAG